MRDGKYEGTLVIVLYEKARLVITSWKSNDLIGLHSTPIDNVLFTLFNAVFMMTFQVDLGLRGGL